MQQLLRLELVRAWEHYFRQKGGAAPVVPADILPVVIMDDNTRGPYPAYRAWVGGNQADAVAAQYSYVGVINQDDPAQKSCVVVDEVIFRTTTTDDAWIGCTTKAILALGTLSNVVDVAEEKDAAPSDFPRLGNVQIGLLRSAQNQVGTKIPNGAITYQRLPGPWTLGPQAVLYLQTVIVNNTLIAFFRGRYYPQL